MLWFLLYLIGIFPSLWFMCKTASNSDSNGEIFMCALLWPITLPFVGIEKLKDSFTINNAISNSMNKWREK